MVSLTLDIPDVQLACEFPGDEHIMYYMSIPLHRVRDGKWICLSADLDYEQVGLEIVPHVVLPRHAPFPDPITRGSVYAFDPITHSDIEYHRKVAKVRASLLGAGDLEDIENDVGL